MSNPPERIASLSPEKRRLFERMRQKPSAPPELPVRDAPGDPPEGSVSPEGQSGLMTLEPLDAEKGKVRRFYDSVSALLDPTPFGEFAFFLNYGFVSDGSREFAAVNLPEHELNRNSVKLVLEVIGDCPLAAQAVLDVGCGRGGTVTALHRFFRPAQVCALDLSPNNIRFCRQTHHFPNTEFIEGDAEQLPFSDGAFDILINIESSHLYPNVLAFYREAHRVLRTGGHFLYADLQPAERWPVLRRSLREQTFACLRERDITSNVLLSCDQVASARVEAYSGGGHAGVVEDFLAAPGSLTYRELARHAYNYRIFTLRKS